VTTLESIAIVTAAEPLKEVPVKPVPIVNGLVVDAVTTVFPPRETVCPFTVTELLVNFELAIEPASIALVTVAESPVVTTVPEVAGKVIVVEPDVAGT